MILIAKETPHLFMWFSDGSKIPAGISPLPQTATLNYIQRLKEECDKLFLTKTPVYLVYMGRLLSKEQKTLLENLQKESPNLSVIDYDEVEQSISDQVITRTVFSAANSYLHKETLDVGAGGIADLVDLTRLILLYNSNILRNIAQRKISVELTWCEGLVYRDFDVTLEKETMPDILTTHGYMATLNFSEKVRKHHNLLLESAEGKEDATQRITNFFNKHIYNLERYQLIVTLFTNNKLTIQEQHDKEALLSEYKKICRSEDDFKSIFINAIFIENSFLAINKDQHPLIEEMIKEVCYQGNSPYAAVQRYLLRNFKRRDYIYEFLTPQRLGFSIGNDLTWKMSVRQQYQSEPSTPALPSQPQENVNERENEETVSRLSTLTNEYLRHLDKSSNKNHPNFRDKNTIALDLKAILDNTSNCASTKLTQFATRLQEADKKILKNHRDRAWVVFKQVALVLLGMTVIGAVVGGIDYAIRGHHSLFCTTKSHGERFIVDVEKYTPPTVVIN